MKSALRRWPAPGVLMLLVSGTVGTMTPALADVRPSHTVTFGPHDTEGYQVAHAGDLVAAGLAIRARAPHPALIIDVENAVFKLPTSCRDKGRVGAVVSIPLRNQTFAVPIDDDSPRPSSSPSAPESFQGSVTLPALCGSGPIYLGMIDGHGPSLEAAIHSSVHSAVLVRFHYRDPQARGYSSTDCSSLTSKGERACSGEYGVEDEDDDPDDETPPVLPEVPVRLLMPITAALILILTMVHRHNPGAISASLRRATSSWARLGPGARPGRPG